MSTTCFSLARTCLFAGVFVLAACPAEEQKTTDTDPTAATDATTDMTTTGPTSTTETSAPTSTDGTTDGTTEPMTGGDSTTGDSTTDGMIPAELDAACESLCEKFIECDWDPQYSDVDSCKLDCFSDTPPGSCIAPSAALYACIGGVTCEELLSQDWVSCAAEEEALPKECAEPDCENLGSTEGPDTCSYGYVCANTPAQEIRCEGDTCTCLVDGAPMGTCGSSEGFCDLDPFDKDDIAFDCCGFEF